MSALPILGYKRHPRPVLGKDPAKDLYALGAYLDSELQRLENSFDTNSQQTEEVDDGVNEAKQQVIALSVTTGQNTAAISQEATTRTSADSALSTLVTNLSATVTSGDNTNSAAISSEQTARANADTALSSTVSSLTSTVSGVSASVTAEASARVAADNTLLAKYGVKLNSNGYITGFSQNNDGTTGTFKILADEFKIIDPAASAGSAGVEVFAVSGGYATIKNIRSAASGARLQIDSDVMSVFDASGVLRVKLGNLS